MGEGPGVRDITHHFHPSVAPRRGMITRHDLSPKLFSKFAPATPTVYDRPSLDSEDIVPRSLGCEDLFGDGGPPAGLSNADVEGQVEEQLLNLIFG